MAIKKECDHFNTCSAPLCPLDNESMEHGIWYSDEEVCKVLRFARLMWIRNQKKIQRKSKDDSTYYTVEMINRKIIIRGGVMGINPNRDNTKELEQKWIENHPEFVMSVKKIEAAKAGGERFHKMREEAKIKSALVWG